MIDLKQDLNLYFLCPHCHKFIKREEVEIKDQKRDKVGRKIYFFNCSLCKKKGRSFLYNKHI